MSDQFVSAKLDTLAKAQAKAEEAAAVIQARFPGSSLLWDNERTLRVMSNGRPIATILLESLQ